MGFRSPSSSKAFFFFCLSERLITTMNTMTAGRHKEHGYNREPPNRQQLKTDFVSAEERLPVVCVRFTTECQDACQDGDGDSHCGFESLSFWCHIAVAQLCAVAYSHWNIEVSFIIFLGCGYWLISGLRSTNLEITDWPPCQHCPWCWYWEGKSCLELVFSSNAAQLLFLVDLQRKITKN